MSETLSWSAAVLIDDTKYQVSMAVYLSMGCVMVRQIIVTQRDVEHAVNKIIR